MGSLCSLTPGNFDSELYINIILSVALVVHIFSNIFNVCRSGHQPILPNAHMKSRDR